MDLTTFSQESFEPKEWINSIFRSPEAHQNRDHYASSQVLRLQLAIQEVNNALEETSQQVMASLPRVLRDIESLGHEVAVLKNQMKSVRQDIEKVEHNTAASMQTLVKLDSLKGKISASSQALREADNWTTLSTDIEEVMDSGDIDAIASKLVALQNCLGILTHVPDYEDRVAHLEGLKVRLEALASPHIVAAFTQHNLDESVKYARLLRSLGRVDQLESYYHKCEIGQLGTAWRNGVEGSQLSGPALWLTSFYDRLSLLISNQLRWCGQVFEGSDANLLLSQLAASTLSSLDPPISQVIAASTKQQEEPLAFLISVKSSGDQFLRDFESSVGIAKPGQELLYQSQRAVLQAIYSPLQEQVLKYQEYEEALLLSHLISADIVKNDMAETLRRLREYCSKLSSQAEVAAERMFAADKWMDFPKLDFCISELVMAVDNMEHSLATMFTNAAAKFIWEPATPFSATPDLLLSKQGVDNLRQLVVKVVDEDDRLLENSMTQSQAQCQSTVEVALHTIMNPVSSQLASLPDLPAWNSRQGTTSHLSLSFSPQEYVTQIGQYLMTLPQHLEPLLVNHSPALNRALQEANTTCSSGPSGRVVSESEVSAADFLINSVGQNTCKLYTDAILKIPEITTSMITQLTTDIDYICNILEDLGVTSCDSIRQLNLLLKAPVEQYWKIAPGNNPRLIAAVRQMRNIPVQS
ncbi:LOW QUALITY PROTEIN: conserved oligomeric Golgi complex subunit 7-like [Penaeus monodon]|uniref:LOW QUALITY PROTEIN: conserved oligomeric Golgi complex subunit 7-like n=1 Tax=Penaeus monodon TaxID=6687 RepID=UPI0018A762F2|nr:LOW QUALITY PROTEIN: conserved oligomeric Golgi complex subunit 7-like [Penaeus monodon]